MIRIRKSSSVHIVTVRYFHSFDALFLCRHFFEVKIDGAIVIKYSFLYRRGIATLAISTHVSRDFIALCAVGRVVDDGGYHRTSRYNSKELGYWRREMIIVLASSVAPPSICYDDLGCFSPRPGFKLLPQSPEKINTQFLLFTR